MLPTNKHPLVERHWTWPPALQRLRHPVEQVRHHLQRVQLRALQAGAAVRAVRSVPSSDARGSQDSPGRGPEGLNLIAAQTATSPSRVWNVRFPAATTDTTSVNRLFTQGARVVDLISDWFCWRNSQAWCAISVFLPLRMTPPRVNRLLTRAAQVVEQGYDLISGWFRCEDR